MEVTGTLQDYVCGGYFLARVARSYRKSAFLPNAIVTVSECLTQTLPNSWAIEWMQDDQKRRQESARRCGLDGDDIERFILWTTERVNRDEIGVNNVMFSKSTADDLLQSFAFDRTDWRLLALGLRKDRIESFLANLRPDQGPRTFGVRDAVKHRKEPNPKGDLLGYDVLGMNGCGEFHSWFCNSLEERIATELGIRPGPDGLLATYAEAEACAEYAARPGAAEPVAWHPFAMINYPI
jgi:hypothetical protein